MTERTENDVPPPVALTDAELRALAYFGVGIGSEGGDSGRDVSHRLSFAGNVRNGVMMPVGNSGYSIGAARAGHAVVIMYTKGLDECRYG